MNLQRLIAEYRKISRRLRRRSIVATQRQIQAWKRRLAFLEQRIRLAGGVSMRRVAMASAMAAIALPQLGHATASKIVFTSQDPGFTLLKGDPSLRIRDYAQAAFADIDGDGDLDAFVSDRNGKVHFFLNEGNKQHPKFTDKTQDSSANPLYGFNIGSYRYKGITIGDVDGDGDLDIVVTMSNPYQNLRFLENTGNAQHPQFVDSTYSGHNPFYDLAYSYSSASSPRRPVLLDLDHDGDLDLIMGYYDNVQYYKNVGTPTAANFQLQTGANDPFNGLTFNNARYLWAAAGDVDGDGDLDLLVGAYNTYGFELWRNTGTAQLPKFSNEGYIPGLFVAYGSPSLADVDGDGDLDLFSGNWNRGIQNWTNAGNARHPRWNQPVVYYSPGDSQVFADVDSDGDIDQLAYSVFNRNDGGTFSAYRQSPQNPFYYLPYYAGRAFGDVDGDGDNDMVIAYSGTIRYFRKDGRPGQLTFTELTGTANPFNGVSTPSNYNQRMVLADVDGDGDLDLVIAPRGNGYLQLVLNTGTASNPSFSNVSPASDPFYGTGYHSGNLDLIVGDVDGDGDTDLVVASGSFGQSRYYRNDTTGAGMPTLTAVLGADDPFASIPSSVYGYPMVVDYDHDGDLDILIWNNNASAFFAMRNDTTRFNLVDPVAVAKDKIILGPVPAKAGEDVCVFVDRPTDSVDVDLYNLAGEHVQSGLTGVTASHACFKANVAPGLYWARIKSGDRTFTQKIIISAK